VKKAGTAKRKVLAVPASRLERETGFEPATLSLGSGFTGSPDGPTDSQTLRTAGGRYDRGVQRSQPKQTLLRGFATPLLRDSASGVAPPAGPMLTVREVARALRVSTATVYKLCARGELAHVRVLNVIRIPEGVLGSFVR
jgi:excisionase family DNA binding protein